MALVEVKGAKSLTNLYAEGLEVTYTDSGNSKEERVVYLNGVVLSDEEVEQEEEQNIAMRDLYLGAQSLKLAKKMERERQEYFESLYDFSYGVSNITEEPYYLGSTESNALRIIDQKESYNLKIVKLKERYSHFRGVLSGLNESDSNLLRNYFENGYKVEYEELRACISRLSSYLYEHGEARRKSLDAEAMKRYVQDRKTRRIADSKSDAKQNEGKQQYLIDGKFIYLDDNSHKALKQQEIEKRQAFKQRFADTFEIA